MKPLTQKHTARRPRLPIAGLGAAGVSALLLAGICQAQSAHKPPGPASPAPGESVWLAASDRTLDQMRGGFDLGSGLVVSFGIERSVSINGRLITSTSLQIGGLTGLTSPQAAALQQQLATQTLLVKNGQGNTVESGAVSVPFATYIQNSLNNQTLSSRTVIDATSNSMGIVKGLNLQATINEAIAQAIGTR